jgi:predicted permease
LRRGCHLLRSVGRLSEGSSIADARRELSVLARRLESEHGDTNTGKSFAVLALEDYLLGGSVRTALFVLLAAVAVVLVIACANVAHLLLARSSERAGEIAVRAALGASRSRIVRQLLLEALVMATASTAAGLALAAEGLRALLDLAPSTIPRLEQVSLDGTVLGFALATSLCVTLAFGLVPGFDLGRASLTTIIGHGARMVRARSRLREAILGAQVALSLALLFAAGLLLRSFAELRGTELGFVKEGVLTFDLLLPEATYPGADGRVRIFETIETDLRSLPGVESVGSVFGSPMGPHSIDGEVTPLDRPAPPPGEELNSRMRVVTPGYLDTLGVPLLRGRRIEERDRRDRQPIALVNESFVRKFYPGRDPLGQQLRLSVSFGYPEEEPRTIVGVVGDFRSRSVVEPAEPEVYLPQAQLGCDHMTVLIRVPFAGDALLSEVKSTTWGRSTRRSSDSWWLSFSRLLWSLS